MRKLDNPLQKAITKNIKPHFKPCFLIVSSLDEFKAFIDFPITKPVIGDITPTPAAPKVAIIKFNLLFLNS